jgi:hypothetical protein
MRMYFVISAVALLLSTAAPLSAQPEPQLWQRWEDHDPDSTRQLDHRLWADFLETYLITDHPSGINLLPYGEVSIDDRRKLERYIDQLENTRVSALKRDVQAAFWINLYNAYTVHLVLEHYPVESIRDINLSGFLAGLFGGGPWGRKLITVEGTQLSLNDIEHRILRPIWQDARIHYAVNCASLGCPNLMPVPYTGENYRELFDRGARQYINHPRGVTFRGDRLLLSEIYRWYREDFSDSLKGVKQHLLRYADAELAERLREHAGAVRYRYDWSLNEP